MNGAHRTNRHPYSFQDDSTSSHNSWGRDLQKYLLYRTWVSSNIRVHDSVSDSNHPHHKQLDQVNCSYPKPWFVCPCLNDKLRNLLGEMLFYVIHLHAVLRRCLLYVVDVIHIGTGTGSTLLEIEVVTRGHRICRSLRAFEHGL